jgi:N-methylhydantoinase B
VRFPLEEGDIVVMETSGGGGYGDPLRRDLHEIERDLSEGFVTEEKARIRYGVAFIDGRIDKEESRRLREELQKRRIDLRAVRWEGEEGAGSRRLCLVEEGTLKDLGLEEGDLVELIRPGGAPLRAWVKGLEEGERETAYLGQAGLEILGDTEGEKVELRKIAI